MTKHKCLLCNDTYEEESNLRVHLEVEHRKSELASHIVENRERSADPTVERERSPTTIP